MAVCENLKRFVLVDDLVREVVEEVSRRISIFEGQLKAFEVEQKALIEIIGREGDNVKKETLNLFKSSLVEAICIAEEASAYFSNLSDLVPKASQLYNSMAQHKHTLQDRLNSIQNVEKLLVE